MFDRCRAWRRLLARQAEGALTPSERALLDTHLSQCASCRRTEAADKLLRAAYNTGRQHMSPRAARAFDDRVLQTLRAQSEPAIAAGLWERLRSAAPGLSFEFWGQLAGGALMAAAVTAFFLVSALHPTAAVRATTASDLATMSTLESNAPPVSLESLFQTRSPRAASLWAAPSESRFRGAAPVKKDNVQPDSATKPGSRSKPAQDGPRPHSEQPHTVSFG